MPNTFSTLCIFRVHQDLLQVSEGQLPQRGQQQEEVPLRRQPAPKPYHKGK